MSGLLDSNYLDWLDDSPAFAWLAIAAVCVAVIPFLFIGYLLRLIKPAAGGEGEG
jgi:hypothetical protein